MNPYFLISLLHQTNNLQITRLALTSMLGPFLVYLLKFTVLTPFLHTFFFSLLLLGSHPGSLMHYLGLLEFPVRIWCLTHHNTHEPGAVPNLSYEYDCDLITGFPFALVFTCTFTECVTLHHEVHELDGYNQEFWKTSGYSLKCVSRLNFTLERDSSLVPIKWPYHLHAKAVVPT